MIKYTYDTKHKLNTSNSEQVCLQLLLESFLRVFPDGSSGGSEIQTLEAPNFKATIIFSF